MINTKYANVYKEVLCVINNLIKEDYEKIPKEYIKFLKENCNNEYGFEYDSSKSFKEQELLDDTKYILFGLFEKFGSTELQQKEIKAFKNNYYRKLDEEKKTKYNTDIFQDRNKHKQEKYKENIITNEVAMVEYKESLYRKIINKIKEIFH